MNGFRGTFDVSTQWPRGSTLAVIVFMVSLAMAALPALAMEVGDKAPDFLMHSSLGETVRLSDYQGKKNVLLFFFLAAFTSV
jgi:hypothetical protein